MKKQSLENFQPKLKEGRLEVVGNSLIYEIKSPFRQITVPLYLADVLTLCNGNNSVREIIEKIYKKQKTVRFRETCETILLLKRKDLFENGDRLQVNDSALDTSPGLPAVMTRFGDFFSLTLAEKISAPKQPSWIFAGLALGIFGYSLFLGLNLLVDFSFTSSLQVDGSYLLGLGHFFMFFSILVSFKSLVKVVLLLASTGKVFDLRLRATPLFFGLFVSNESTNLMDKISEKTIYYLTVISSHFLGAFVISQFVTTEGLDMKITLAAILLLGYEVNPMGWGELKDWINSFKISDPKNPWYLLQYKPNQTVKIGSSLFGKYKWVYDSYMVTWGVLSLLFFAKLTYLNYPYFDYVATSAPEFTERLAAIYTFSFLVIGDCILSYFSILALKNQYWSQFKEGIQSFRNTVSRERLPYLDRRQINDELLKLPVINWFSEEELAQLLDTSRFVSLRKGQVIYDIGERAQHLLVLLNGKVQMQTLVDANAHRIKKWDLLPISILGEECLLKDSTRESKAVASKLSTMVEIPMHEVFQLIDETHYQVQLDSFRTAIMLNQYFHSAPIFSELSDDAINFMMAKGVLEEVNAGETVFAEGTTSRYFYMLIKGSVKVIVNGDWVNVIPRGGFFGEIGVIADIPRTATIEAEADCVLFKISADDFWEVLTQKLETAIFIEAVGELRLKSEHKFLEKKKSA